MADPMVPIEELACHGVQEKSSSTNGSSGNIERQGTFSGDDKSRRSAVIDTLYPEYDFRQDEAWEQDLLPSTFNQQEQQLHVFFDNQLQEGSEDTEPKKKEQYPFFLTSFELLNSYGNGLKSLNSERIIETSDYIPRQKVISKELSAEEIIRIAGAKFIQSSPKKDNVDSILEDPLNLSFPDISEEQLEKVQLVELLLAAAEKVGNEQFDSAKRLLKAVDCFSSKSGNSVQRLVYYFSEALRGRIDNKTGKNTSEGLGEKQSFDLTAATMTMSPATLAYHQHVPFFQIARFAGIQAIVDNVMEAKRIHVIDFLIRSGVQWSILMQALISQREFPLEHLKITAIGTCKHVMEDTGKRLMSFAQTMNLPFSFHVVLISDFLELKEDMLNLDAEETVAIYFGFSLSSLLGKPDRLDSIMKLTRNISPCIIVVAEMEANHNSPAFVLRFVEALFYYSANFDCLDACMECDDPNRTVLESMYFSEGIKSIVTGNKEERKIRSVKIDVWRVFFSRYGMVEVELSTSCLDQANLVTKKHACAECCTIYMDDKSLIIGWKNTPINSLSAWKFIF